MRVYRRAEFLKLPAGTIYCRGGEWHFGALTRKEESTDYGDWYEVSFDWIDGSGTEQCLSRLEEMLATGASYPMQDSVCRNGEFDDADLFLVFEKADLEKLRGYIDEAIGIAG